MIDDSFDHDNDSEDYNSKDGGERHDNDDDDNVHGISDFDDNDEDDNDDQGRIRKGRRFKKLKKSIERGRREILISKIWTSYRVHFQLLLMINFFKGVQFKNCYLY